MRNRLLLAASTMAISLVCSAVSAQEQSGALAFGQSVESAIPSGGRDYTVNLQRGQRLEVIMRSGDLDAYLRIFQQSDLDTELASDDDGLGKGTNARLRYTARESGTYVIRAAGLDETSSGDATVEANLISPPTPARAKRIRLGGTERGTISANSAEDDAGNFYDLYRVRLSQGDRVAIRLESDDFDSYLEVGKSEGSYFDLLAQNDDGPDGVHSYLVFVAPNSGEFDIRARGLSMGAQGRYSIALEEAPPRQAATALSLGSAANGELGEKSATNSSGVRADLYSFEARSGQRYEITLTSDDFDTFLELYNAAEASISSDDDGAGDLNSRIVFTPEADGTYYIEARALSESSGRYEVKVDVLAPPPPLQSLELGKAIEAELSDEDGTLGGKARFDGYSLQLSEGQRVQIVMRSGEFDTVLEIGEDNESFKAIETDDDGLGQGTNSRLLFQAPKAGTYVVRARSYEADARGTYDLEASDRGPEPEAGSVMIGATVRSNLSERDNTRDNGAYFDDYVITAKADEKLRFTMVASGMDAYVIVGEMRDGELRELSSDDDGLSDTHARLNWTAPREGSYVVRATSFGANETGDYTLTVERQP